MVGTGQDQVSAPKHIGEEEVETNVHPNVPESHDNITGTIPIYLTLEEKSKAEKLLIRAIQAYYFEKEISNLFKMGVFDPNSVNELRIKASGLLSLSPFLDDEGVLRVGGRLGMSKSIPYDQRHPIILPGAEEEVIQSLIRHYHLQNYHCTSVETHYLIKQKFYLMGGKNSVKKVVSKCVDCQKAAKLPFTQKMGDLPEERVTIAAPFATTGLDVFGHFTVTHTGRGEKKVWVLLATCFTTRAVALYPLVDMTLSSVIQALVKMHSQFPSLRKIFSDNGSNFKGANMEIKEAVAYWNEGEANERLSEQGIEWSFGPAACGSYGGVWERLVGIVKNSFKACMNGKTLSRDAFDALCAAVAGVVNRRPLTRADNSQDDMLVLSPAHFIYPYQFIHSSSDIIPPIPDDGDHLRTTWKVLRERVDEFWQIWRASYLDTLQTRQKWQKSAKPIKVDDVVIITDPLLPRDRWKIGVVESIIGRDENHARRFIIRDSDGTKYDRHVSGIVLLELQ